MLGVKRQDQIELCPCSTQRNGIQRQKWITISAIFPLRFISRDKWKKWHCVRLTEKNLTLAAELSADT